MTNTDIDVFLQQLQEEAHNQAKLREKRVLPHHLDWLTSLIGTHSWQSIATASFLTAILIQILKNI